MEIIIINKPQKNVQLSEEQFNDLTSELVPTEPDEVARNFKRIMDRVSMTDEYGKKVDYLIQAQKALNMVIAVYQIREALQGPMPTTASTHEKAT